jgi:ATP-binding protein involved in chromosome partitioning
MKHTEKDILYALGHVDDPDLKKDLVTLGMIKNIQFKEDEGFPQVFFDVVLTTPACPLKEEIKAACENAIHHFVAPDLVPVIRMTSQVTGQAKTEVLQSVKNVIAIASGKGGVGKSTVAVNLARALAKHGAKVGILDADVYGPSIPVFFGLKNARPKMEGKLILPIEKDGLKIMSIGFLIDENQPVIWRGPMAASAIKQFIGDVKWGELDYLIIDLPPGTGDIHLTISQSANLMGSIMVTTPQDVAVVDCKKAIAMFNSEHVKIPILGIVENMAYFSPTDLPDNKYFIFGQGGAQKLSDEFNLPVLAEIPIHEKIRENSDSGDSIFDSGSSEKGVFYELASKVAQQIAIENQKTKENELSSEKI